MNLSDIVGRYTNRATTLEVSLPLGEKVVMRRIMSTSEWEQIQDQAIKWAKDARALAPDQLSREAMGELAGVEQVEIIVRACMLADSLIESTEPQDSRRYGMCVLAAYSAPIFKKLWDAFSLSFLGNAVEHVADAVEGKAGCGKTPPCGSDCECAAMSGDGTPTN